MPQILIRKTIEIKKEPSSISPFIRDFHQWVKWSPWLILDPKVSVKVDASGNYFAWDSPILGAGEMHLLHQENHEFICSLEFFKPWRSKAQVCFYLNPMHQGTLVVWTMKTDLPLYLFWMKKQMKLAIELDYERGLKLLKSLVETGSSESKLLFNGLVETEETPYLGLRRKTSYSEFKNAMSQDFKKLIQYAQENFGEQLNGPPFSIYNEFTILKNKVDYTVGIPIKHYLAELKHSHSFLAYHRPALKAYSIEHQGPYKHLPNAWAAQFIHQRSGQFKRKKSIPPLEIYHNSPSQSKETIFRTEILFPCE